jgi:Sec-independent protein translocase protein TatA
MKTIASIFSNIETGHIGWIEFSVIVLSVALIVLISMKLPDPNKQIKKA